jgi:putative Mg2+ transporter-C (MgtC) family protein
MTPDQVDVLLHLGTAMAAGGLIGLERELHGRPAGFRTHILVCLASALVMQATLFPGIWAGRIANDALRIEPIQLAQGIMTGIGFLGAGEIFREGWHIRGLTTAASIWATAALGIVAGLGLYFAVAAATLAILAVLIVLNWIEERLPVDIHVRHVLKMARDDVMDEDALRALLRGHGFEVPQISQVLVDNGRAFEYRLRLKTRDREAPERLSRTLRARRDVIEFEISPRGD